VKLVMVGLDVTRKAILTRPQLEAAITLRSDPRAQFLRCVCEQMFHFYQRTRGEEFFHLHDPLAVAIAIDRTLTGMQGMYVDVETAGELTRGMTVAERRVGNQAASNVEVAVSHDQQRFLRAFIHAVFET